MTRRQTRIRTRLQAVLAAAGLLTVLGAQTSSYGSGAVPGALVPDGGSGADPAPADGVHYTFTGPTSVAFDWRGGTDEIRYGATADYGLSATASEPSPLSWASPGPYREVQLSGLAPDTTYHYSAGGSTDHTFRTAPDGPFRFVAVGDIGESVTYPWIDEMMEQIATEHPAFVLALGDLTYANKNCPEAVDQHFNDVQAWSLEAAYMPVWGNHEYARATRTSQPCAVDDDFANYKGRFALPNAQGLASNGPTTESAPGCAPPGGTNPCQGEDWYWFDAGPVRFVAGPEPFDGAVAQWHREVQPIMAEAEADPEISFVVTATHRPMYSSAGRVTADYRTAIDALGDEFDKYVLNLNGHNHTNEVFEPQHGVAHVTAGAGGEGLDRLPAPIEGSVYQLEHTGYAVLDVNESSIGLDVVCGPDIAAPFEPDECTTGETVASFDLTRRPPRADWATTCDAATCRFDARTSTDRDGTVEAYDWDFGDGATGAGVAPEHTFAGPGVYDVRLTVTDEDGNTDRSDQLVTVGAADAVSFRAARSASRNVVAHRVQVPAAVRTGDGLLAFLTTNKPALSATTPDGWQLVDTVQTSGVETFVWQRVADASSAGTTVRFPLDGRAQGTTTLLAYDGTASEPVGAVGSGRETVRRDAHTTPAVRLATSGAPLVSYWSDRGSTTGWTLPAAVTGRSQSAGTGTGHTSAVAGDSGRPTTAGAAGSLVATAAAASAHATAVTVLLAPGT